MYSNLVDTTEQAHSLHTPAHESKSSLVLSSWREHTCYESPLSLKVEYSGSSGGGGRKYRIKVWVQVLMVNILISISLTKTFPQTSLVKISFLNFLCLFSREKERGGGEGQRETERHRI